jgi:hypothetical protein
VSHLPRLSSSSARKMRRCATPSSPSRGASYLTSTPARGQPLRLHLLAAGERRLVAASSSLSFNTRRAHNPPLPLLSHHAVHHLHLSASRRPTSTPPLGGGAILPRRLHRAAAPCGLNSTAGQRPRAALAPPPVSDACRGGAPPPRHHLELRDWPHLLDARRGGAPSPAWGTAARDGTRGSLLLDARDSARDPTSFERTTMPTPPTCQLHHQHLTVCTKDQQNRLAMASSVFCSQFSWNLLNCFFGCQRN